jgi:hypothetical protein
MMPKVEPRDPLIISPSMLAELTALLFSVVALALSAWLYVASVGNRSALVRTQKLELKSEALQTQLGALRKSVQEQQERMDAAPAAGKGRPAIVSDTITIADWNNNAKLKELLAKHGYAGPPAASKSK